MSFTKIINNAIHDILVDTFPGIRIRPTTMEAGFQPEFQKDEFIEYWIIDQPIVGTNSDGETREYVYGINHYFHKRLYRRLDFEGLYSDRFDKLKEAIMENVSYYKDGSYIWHDARVENMAFRELEHESYGNVKYYNMELVITRFNQWG